MRGWNSGTLTRGLLARTNEDEAVVGTPKAVRVAVVAVEPTLTVAMPDEEHAEVFKGVRIVDGFHPDQEPLALRLVRILQTQLRSDLCGTELETRAQRSFDDVPTVGPVFEAEVHHRHIHEVHVHLRFADPESGLAEDVIAPVAYAVAGTRECLAELVGGLETGAELDGLPDVELGRVGNRDHELTTEESIYTVFTTQFVPDGFYATQRIRILAHNISLPTSSRIFLLTLIGIGAVFARGQPFW